MRRVEHHHSERVVRVWHTCEVGHHIGIDLEFSSVTERCRYLSNVLKQNIRVVLVEVEHLSTATSVKDWFIHFPLLSSGTGSRGRG